MKHNVKSTHWAITSIRIVGIGIFSLIGMGMLYGLMRYFVQDLSTPAKIARATSALGVALLSFTIMLWILKTHSSVFAKNKIVAILTFGKFAGHIVFIMFMVNIGLYASIEYFSKAASSSQCFSRQDVQRGCFQTNPSCYYIDGGTVYTQGTCSQPHNCSLDEPENCHPCGSDISGKLPVTHVYLPKNYLEPNIAGYLYGANTTCPENTPTPVPTATHTPSPIPTLTPTQMLTPSISPTGSITPSPSDGTPTPTTANGQTPTPMPTSASAIGDANNDQVVDEKDLVILLGEFGSSGGTLSSDFNNDGKVNLIDYHLMIMAKTNQL